MNFNVKADEHEHEYEHEHVKAAEHEEEPIYENSNISHISQRPNPVSNSFVHGRHEVVHGHDSGDGGPVGAQRFQMTKILPKISSDVISRIFPYQFQLICIISVSDDCMHSGIFKIVLSLRMTSQFHEFFQIDIS